MSAYPCVDLLVDALLHRLDWSKLFAILCDLFSFSSSIMRLTISRRSSIIFASSSSEADSGFLLQL